MSFETTLDKILERYENLKQQMLECVDDSENFIKLSKEFANLEDFATVINKYKKAKNELAELEEVIHSEDTDAEFKELAISEAESLKTSIPQLEKEIKRIKSNKTENKNNIN